MTRGARRYKITRRPFCNSTGHTFLDPKISRERGSKYMTYVQKNLDVTFDAAGEVQILELAQ